MTLILWVDFETTGLDPEENFLLEMAAYLTDSHLEIVDSMEEVYLFHNDALRLTFDPIVQDMHTANGLWDACKQGRSSIGNDGRVIQMLRDAGAKPQEVLLGGSTINFDRDWIKQWMPILYNFLSYHNLDVSSIKRCMELWRDDIVGISPSSSGNHRAGPDIMATINLMKFYRDFVILKPKELGP